MLPYQRLGGEAPKIPLLVIATYVMRSMHFASVKVTWRQLDELKLCSSYSITHNGQIDVCKRVKLLLFTVQVPLGEDILWGKIHPHQVQIFSMA